MVVILLLTPYTTNGCDGGSNESSTISTTSTGDTAILTTNYKAQQHKQQQQQKYHFNQSQWHNLHHDYPTNYTQQQQQYQRQQQHLQQFSSHKNSYENCGQKNETTGTITYTNIPNNNSRQHFQNYSSNPTVAYTARYAIRQPEQDQEYYENNTRFPHYHTINNSSISITPTQSKSTLPPPLPKTKPPYVSYFSGRYNLYANVIPKPLRSKECQHCEIRPNQQHTYQEYHFSFVDPPEIQTSISLQEDMERESISLPISISPTRVEVTSNNFSPTRPITYNPNKSTNTIDFVRHVTRVNFYDIDTLQAEYESKDENDFDTEAITKEEEWITKRKTELTTTRQIKTHVKRNVVLEDGKVVEDSGPIVSTSTTEDTDKQETESTEKRDLGIPVDESTNPNNVAILENQVDCGQLAEFSNGGTVIKKMIVRPADGLVRETNDKRVISHEEVKDYLETEDVKHLGDFSDDAFVKAVNSGTINLEAVLYLEENQKQLVPLGPKVVANTSKSFKTIDTEDKQKRCLTQEDGKIVTERKTTTEHEIIVDKDQPDGDDKSTGSQERIRKIESSQRYFKQRDEQHVDLVKNGKVVDTEMKYAAETMQMEKEGSLERPGDWDSLSDRMRKMRRPLQKTLMQQHKVALLTDRKDALTKRPLDFDREEETRKGETMKWLESHFGSESTVSNDDEDTEIEPTKKTFFNVTIKSNQAQNTATANGNRPTNTYEKKYFKDHETSANNVKSKYYQGISNWTDRKDVSTNHFATKAFRDDLQETVERNRLKKNTVYSSRDILNDSRYVGVPNDNYVRKEDILQQKRHSISSQFLARSRRSTSHDKLNEEEPTPTRLMNGFRTDLHYNTKLSEEDRRLHTRINNDNMRSQNIVLTSGIRVGDNNNERSKSYERELSNSSRYDIHTTNYKNMRHSPTSEDINLRASTLGRPTVPQRRRAIEKKLRQQSSVSPTLKVPLQPFRNVNEPPPDYLPPSRSSSPQIDYISHSLNSNRNTFNGYTTGHAITTLTRKQNQRTRFAPTSSPTSYNAATLQRPVMATQTTQTTPSTLSTSTAASHKSSKVSQVIGNSLRKLVNKIRSASVERKMRMKSKSKSREQSPSPQSLAKQRNTNGTTTYQQYNLIDSHIVGQPDSNDSERESVQHEQIHTNKIDSGLYHNESALTGRNNQRLYKRAESADAFVNERDTDQITSPRQRYYLGEDPYSSTLYGKENIYDPNSIAKRNRNIKPNIDFNYVDRNVGEIGRERQNDENNYDPKNIASNTLGRYQKSIQRFAGSTPNLNHDLRSTQTLPRKLHEKHQVLLQQQQRNKTTQRFVNGHHTLGHPEKRSANQSNVQMGPAKPARTYAKALNRSKSFNFNVHGMNGSNDPSPIYIEKLTKNSYTSNLHNSHAYKSNPHLFSDSRDIRDINSSILQSGLKSPSIVNLISRSQKDLTKIDVNDDEELINYGISGPSVPIKREDKKQIFLNELQQQSPELYKTLHGNDDNPTRTTSKYTLHSKSSLDCQTLTVELNKDTAGIIRRSSTNNNEYISASPYNYPKTNEMPQSKRILLHKDDQKRRGSGPTIIEVRNTRK
ncbi:uncharacterized protein LOC119672007 isoform X2 [Teleopsis dalmanni]|uniref:uncharacterized protein LOC119672007 isoform X2 n=1 Tax=Teleopsis dalmanni TaxID=139649 RepID=UPI0018CF2B78|nr:uncharacterized protein LOC119672007 isoform X2 [Teleopsis dalmanni]